MYASISNDISQFFVIIGMPEEKRIVIGDIKNLGEHIECVETLFVMVVEAGTLEFVADGDLEFRTMDIFENEAGSARDAN